MRAQGLFISRFQISWTPRPWQSYVIAKCTDGLTNDPLYQTFKQVARDNGVLFGATHYLRSDISWGNQVDHFLENSQDADFLSLDFEGIGNTPSKQFALDAAYATASIKDKSGKKTLFYSSPKYVQEWMYAYDVYWVRNYEDFWCAQWPYSYWSDVLLNIPDETKGWYPRLPSGCTFWKAWQYGAEYLARGEYEGVESKHVCLEVFNGTKTDMQNWCNIEPSTEPDAICNILTGIIDFIQGIKDNRGCE